MLPQKSFAKNAMRVLQKDEIYFFIKGPFMAP